MRIPKRLGKNSQNPSGFWGWLASKGFTRLGKPVVDWTITLLDIQPNDQVLEIGFGTGLGIEKLANKATHGKVVGVDHSTLMVQKASKHNASAIKSGKVELKQDDINQLTYPDNTFDKALAVQNLYIWSDPGKALKEIHRVLKSGGKVAIASPAPEVAAGMKISEAAVFNVYSDEEQLQMLRDAGFSRVTLEETKDAGYPRTIAVVGIV